MTHTYTTVHKDYSHDTVAAALAEAMLDPTIFDVRDTPQENRSVLAHYGDVEAKPQDYMIVGWQWTQSEHRLRVYFR